MPRDVQRDRACVWWTGRLSIGRSRGGPRRRRVGKWNAFMRRCRLSMPTGRGGAWMHRLINARTFQRGLIDDLPSCFRRRVRSTACLRSGLPSTNRAAVLPRPLHSEHWSAFGATASRLRTPMNRRACCRGRRAETLERGGVRYGVLRGAITRLMKIPDGYDRGMTELPQAEQVLVFADDKVRFGGGCAFENAVVVGIFLDDV